MSDLDELTPPSVMVCGSDGMVKRAQTCPLCDGVRCLVDEYEETRWRLRPRPALISLRPGLEAERAKLKTKGRTAVE